MSTAATLEQTESTAGHLIVAQLEAHSVSRIYCVPGESYLDVLDGLHDSAIEVITTRHEGGAGFMALAEGRLTGKPGVAMVTRGPGASNAFIAVHTAYQDATPMVLFIGLIPVADRGREAFQDLDLAGCFGSTAKKVLTLEVADSAAEIVNDAMHTAISGRPGPVIVGLPEDLLVQLVRGPGSIPPKALAAAEPASSDLGSLAQVFEKANRPLFVLGGDQWTQSAVDSISRWAVGHGVPVTTDFRASDAVLHASNCYVGMLGYGGPESTKAIFDSADLLVFVGCVRSDVLSSGYTAGLDATTVVINSDPDLIGHFGRIDHQIISAVSEFAARVDEIDPSLTLQDHWMQHAREAFAEFYSSSPSPERGLDLGAAMVALEKEKSPDAVLTFGAGNATIWPARHLSHNSARSLVGPRNGAMGAGVPAAVAASLIFPGRQVISVAGDGCFMMNGQELATGVQYGAQFIVIVVDNGAYGTIKSHQELFYPNRPVATDLANPDFAALARAYGAFGEKVERTEDFIPAFRRAVDSRLPALIHVVQDPSVRPPV